MQRMFFDKKIAAWKRTTLFAQREQLNSDGEYFCRHTTSKKGFRHQNG